MDKLLTMSEKEIKRLQIIGQIEKRQMTQTRAAEQMGISVRQVKRIWKAYKEKGAEGLANKSRGKPSHNRLNPKVRQQALDLIMERYRDFGPTLATEKLAELHGMKLSDESVRQIMIEAGIWKRRRKRKLKVFQMRERRPGLGELVQIDGSDYDWFEGRSPRCTLLVFVDDATGKLLELKFVPHESYFGYCEAVKEYFERYGKPEAFYSDKHGIFHLNTRRITPGDGLTEFGRAMQELDIQILCANTPQAKGRVERYNQTLQDRLPKELRLLGINNPEEANLWLPKFADDLNARFSVTPQSNHDFHRPLTKADNLDLVLCRKDTRILSKNLTFQYNKTLFQIQVDRPTYAMRKAQVTVYENAKGEITILYKNKPLGFTVYYQEQNQAVVVPAKSIDYELRNLAKAHKPAADHPWRKGFKTPLSKKNALNEGDILTLSD